MPRNHSDRDWVIIQGSDFTGNVHPDSELTESPGNHKLLACWLQADILGDIEIDILF